MIVNLFSFEEPQQKFSKNKYQSNHQMQLKTCDGELKKNPDFEMKFIQKQ